MTSNPSDELNAFWAELVACQRDLPRLLYLIAGRAAAAVGEACTLSVLSGDGRWLDPVATHHPDPAILAEMEELYRSIPYEVGSGIAGRVALDGRPAVLNGLGPERLAELVQPVNRIFAERHPIRSMLVVPLLHAGTVLGTLGLLRLESELPYDDEDLATAEALVERAAVALADASDGSRDQAPEEYEALYRYSLDGVLFTAPDGRILTANPAACELLGGSERAICARHRGELVVDDPAAKAALERRLAGGRARAELRMRRLDGSEFVAEVSSSLFSVASGELRAFVVFRDVSEQVAMREDLERRSAELARASVLDPLTGLRNRRGFVQAAGEALAIAGRGGLRLQLLFFDLDGLKSVNDRHGHHAGDRLLERFAATLDAETRALDVSGRLGGDEFVLLVYDASPADAEQVVGRLDDAFATEDPHGPTFSVGRAGWSAEAGEPLDALVARADRAMYEAKLDRRFGGAQDS